MKYTDYVSEAYRIVGEIVDKAQCELITPEHLLLAMLRQSIFEEALFYADADTDRMRKELEQYVGQIDHVNEGDDITASIQLQFVMERAAQIATSSSRKVYDIPHLVRAMYDLEDSMAHYVIEKYVGVEQSTFMQILADTYMDEEDEGTSPAYEGEEEQGTMMWRQFVVCVNENIDSHNPLIGREEELDRTIQVLCRKDKNNPLHVGEPGVGKTALVYGLAKRIEDGNVPARLEGCKIYSMDMGTLLAGTQFRGDFEKRIKSIMDGVLKEGNAIIYIDEIHNLVGAGQTSDGSLDASNMLKPYLESGEIRFIGSTTYQEYNRYFSKSKSLVRRFQQIDILEPSADETEKIIEGLKDKYESFHGVKYASDVVRYAIDRSVKFINDRFLPDKAIDLLDEAGAFRELHPLLDKKGKPKAKRYQTVDTKLIDDVLAKVCKIDAKALREESNTDLMSLAERIKAQIYGQDEAVRQVVESVQMSKAGLLDDNKPIASLLFVGPTGVGKTEVCKVLAKELGIELVRFDMSEYTEKHTVAKLIGSPAGYVGYEDGGLLTDAIRKSPNCVLLLDEIEKAHPDIYNILLQVMDYAKLTDNKGQKADFKNVILIMTSNAGAQYASQASVGFGSSVSAGQAMMTQVKKTFKPEFLNRLSGTVVFRDMDMTMAGLILDKKLRQLSDKLSAKAVTLTLTDDARAHLLKAGYTKQYGAREMDRVIQQQLNPLLMCEILFGKLKKGGEAKVLVTDGTLKLE